SSFSESFRSCRLASSRCILSSSFWWCDYSIRLVGRFEMWVDEKSKDLTQRSQRNWREKSEQDRNNYRRVRSAEGAEEPTPSGDAAAILGGRARSETRPLRNRSHAAVCGWSGLTRANL